jgi:hypothetical protein
MLDIKCNLTSDIQGIKFIQNDQIDGEDTYNRKTIKKHCLVFFQTSIVLCSGVARLFFKKNVAKSSTRVLTQIISLVVHWVMAIPMLDKGCLAVNHGVSSMAGKPPESTGGFTG